MSDIAKAHREAQRLSLSARISELEAEIDRWKRLHADNCKAYDEACADREVFRARVTEITQLEAENAKLRQHAEAMANALHVRAGPTGSVSLTAYRKDFPCSS